MITVEPILVDGSCVIVVAAEVVTTVLSGKPEQKQVRATFVNAVFRLRANKKLAEEKNIKQTKKQNTVIERWIRPLVCYKHHSLKRRFTEFIGEPELVGFDTQLNLVEERVVRF